MRRAAGRATSVVRSGALLVVVLLFAVACAGDETGDENGAEVDQDGDQTEATGDDGDEVELTVWFSREYYVPPQEQLDRFEEENPGVTLNVDVQPADDLFQQLIRMNDAGQELPDVVQLDNFLQPAVAEAGVVVPIQDIVDTWQEEDPELYDQVAEVVWEEGTHDGELVGMANTASMEEVYYRPDWLEEAGVDDPGPETWEEVVEQARAIAEVQPDATPFGWWATRGSGANHVFASMTAMGIEFDGAIPNLTSDAGEYWIEFVQTLSGEDLMHPEAIAWSDDEMRGGFVGSNVGMMLDSIPTSLDLTEAGLEAGEQFALVPMPDSRSGDAEDGVITAPARSFHVTGAAEDHKDVAGRFLRFLMDTEVATAVTLQGGDPPRQSGVLESDEFRAEYPAWTDESVEAFQQAGAFPGGIEFPEAQEVMERFNQEVVDNPDADPSALAEEWQAEFDGVAGE